MCYNILGGKDITMDKVSSTALDFNREVKGKYGTLLVDPPWRFQNKTGKVAPEHKRLSRYPTLSLEEIMEIPVGNVTTAGLDSFCDKQPTESILKTMAHR